RPSQVENRSGQIAWYITRPIRNVLDIPAQGLWQSCQDLFGEALQNHDGAVPIICRNCGLARTRRYTAYYRQFSSKPAKKTPYLASNEEFFQYIVMNVTMAVSHSDTVCFPFWPRSQIFATFVTENFPVLSRPLDTKFDIPFVPPYPA
ncbi:MAG: hypothetical protein QNL16_07970, partial [Rhodobacterales bacterium]